MKKTFQKYNAEVCQSIDPFCAQDFNNAPIGVFDSGFGGLTVVRELTRVLPNESIRYLGDSARCPYGPRELSEVQSFVQQIGAWLVDQGVKLVIIACNTGTAAGLHKAQQMLPVPVMGVIQPGARAAVRATCNRRVGVIATKATVQSGAYTKAMRAVDPRITVFSTATPRFVEIAEQGIRMAEGPFEDYMSEAADVYIRQAFFEIAREYLEPLRRCEIDTLVLGCTHFPLLEALIGSVMGNEIKLISSAEEVVRDAVEMLKTQRAFARDDHCPSSKFYTTGNDVNEFQSFGSRVLKAPIKTVQQVTFPLPERVS